MLEDFRLKVFMAVAEEGSFTRAAKSLGVTQPAVSQNIAELEKQTGAELFSRSPGAVTLTAAGVAFREYASRILYWYAAASAMFGSEGRWSGTRPVRILADACVTRCVLPRTLAGQLGENPATRFLVETGARETVPDLRLWSCPSEARMSLAEASTFLGILPAAAIAPKESGSETVSDLQELRPAIRLAVWTPFVPLLPADLSARIAFETSSIDAIPEMVGSASDLVGVLPALPLFPTCIRLPVSLPDLRRDIHITPSEEFSCTPLYPQLRQPLKDSHSRI